MTDVLLKYKIGITLIPGVGDIVAKKLIAYCGGVEAVFKEKKRILSKIPGIGNSVATSILNQNVLGRAEEEITFILRNNLSALFYLDKNYPSRLKNCNDSPVMLYCKGLMNLNHPKVISIVGTRKATDYGKEMCNQLVEQLAAQDVLIVSGLAYGIDICAHKAALKYNLPTVAVVAHGLDRIYPYLHTSTAEKMLNNGGLATEFLSNTNPDKENFPKRNRIIAGLSDATIVIETATRGGALITAEIANSYNRDVFAVPGKLNDPFSKGCNWLIKINKAALVESSTDIEYLMGWKKNNDNDNRKIQKELFVELNSEEKVIVDLLTGEGSLGIDSLSVKSMMSISKVVSALLNLEFSGIVRCLPGKVYELN